MNANFTVWKGLTSGQKESQQQSKKKADGEDHRHKRSVTR